MLGIAERNIKGVKNGNQKEKGEKNKVKHYSKETTRQEKSQQSKGKDLRGMRNQLG